MTSNNAHITHLLDDLLDGNLNEDQQQIAVEHLAGCTACQQAWASVQSLATRLEDLPGEVAPQEDLWPAIEQEIRYQDAVTGQRTFSLRRPIRHDHTKPVGKWKSAAAILFIIVLGITLSYALTSSWEVSTLAGTPILEGKALSQRGSLNEGGWLETPTDAQAELKVGTIGSVTLTSNTKLQLLSTKRGDHRLHLEKGQIHAKIWAPPRLFFVETPAGTAIDLGCEYTLEVDSSGNSLLHVQSGFVSFAADSREVVVPAGWKVQARPGHYTGTPFAETASPALQDALTLFDFTPASSSAIDVILQEATSNDALTLWELMWHAAPHHRTKIYDQLTTLVTPPQRVNKVGVLNRAPSMIQAWRQKLGVDVEYWAHRMKKKKMEEAQSRTER